MRLNLDSTFASPHALEQQLIAHRLADIEFRNPAVEC
jgi:hypothetical protein